MQAERPQKERGTWEVLRGPARTPALIIVLCALASLNAQSGIQDGFEGASLEPFWTFSSPNNTGSVLLDSSVAHSGTQSLRLSTSGYGDTAYVTHYLDAPAYGTAEVYVYDPLIPSIGYKQMWVRAEATTTSLDTYLIYYDWGTLQTYLYYPVTDPSTGNITWASAFLAPRYDSPGWRRWTVITSPTQVSIQIDGTTVFTRPEGYAVRSLSLSECCIAGYANFDDFTFTEQTSAAFHITLLYETAKAVKSGATIPIKVQLFDSSGQNVSSSAIVLHAVSTTKVSTSISGDVLDAGDANPDNDFRYDAALGSSGGYIFNLKTTGLATGSYTLNFTVNGNSYIYSAPFQVK